MEKFDYKHFFTMIGMLLLGVFIWWLMIYSLMDFAEYGDYPILTHDPNGISDK